MTRATIILRKQEDREKAARWARGVPDGTRVEFKEIKRTLPQNDRMWSMLTEIALQARHYGERLTTNEWKILFLDLLSRECRTVRSLDGVGWVPLRRSSDLSKEEMSNLMILIEHYAAVNNIRLGDEDAA